MVTLGGGDLSYRYNNVVAPDVEQAIGSFLQCKSSAGGPHGCYGVVYGVTHVFAESDLHIRESAGNINTWGGSFYNCRV